VEVKAEVPVAAVPAAPAAEPNAPDAGLEELVAIPLKVTPPPVVAKKPEVRSTLVVKAPVACEFNDAYRSWARQAVTDLRELSGGGERFDKLEDAIGDAMVARDCRNVNKLIGDMRRLAGVREDE
jgi:hypothetical protein